VLSRDRDGRNGAEFALLVADAWQRRGIGRALLKRLVEVPARERIDARVRRHLVREHWDAAPLRRARLHPRSAPDDGACVLSPAAVLELAAPLAS
jgi:GNAT superfamily N-acetyltransferase